MNGLSTGPIRPFVSERSIWLMSSLEIPQMVMEALLVALNARYPRVDLAVTTPGVEAMNRDSLAPGRPVSRPAESVRAWERALTSMDTRVILHIGALAPADRAMASAAKRRAAPVTLLDPALFAIPGRIVIGGDGAVIPDGPHDRAFVADEGTAALAREAGHYQESVSRLATGEASTVADALAQAIREDMRRDQKLERSSSPVRGLFESWLRHSFEKGLLRALAGRRLVRYDSLEALRDALGGPRRILCLGNGPSSAEVQLAEVEYDCLFRVNHMWVERGFLTEADLVFTGGKGTIARLGGGLFGLLSRQSEARLLAFMLWRSFFRPIAYLTVDRMGLFFNDPKWRNVRPTNGAAMIAVATALQPERLYISGVDLFSHPAGAYPGDSLTPNAYTPGHDADSELDLLLEALSGYRGELTILSDALKNEWEAWRARKLA